jgi:hypothetical protein
LDFVNPDQPRNRLEESSKIDTRRSKDAEDTPIELSDVFELPRKTADNTMVEGNGSIRTASSTLADTNLKTSCKGPRSLV